MFSMFPSYPGISSQWELLSQEEIRCSSKSLAVSSVEKGEISKEWKHKDLTGCISWMSRGSSPSCHCASGDLVTASLWHQRLGYTTKMKELKNLVNGVDLPAEKEVPFCEASVEGKLSRKPHKPVGEICSKRKLQLVHRDIWGPMQTESIGRSKYFVTFIDDYSRCLQIQGV